MDYAKRQTLISIAPYSFQKTFAQKLATLSSNQFMPVATQAMFMKKKKKKKKNATTVDAIHLSGLTTLTEP